MSGTARATTREVRDAAYQGVAQSLARIEAEAKADRVTLYRRPDQTIYQNIARDGRWTRTPEAASVLAIERDRARSSEELQDRVIEWRQIKDHISRPERRAERDEIKTVAQQLAYADAAFKASLKTQTIPRRRSSCAPGTSRPWSD